MTHLNQIQGGRWDEELRRTFSMKQGSVAPVLASEIVPAIILENDRPEGLALAATRLGMGSSIILASAGVFSQIQLFNPAGSGVLGVATRARMASNGASTLTLRLGNVALTNASLTATKADSRLIDFAIGASFRTSLEIRDVQAALTAGTVLSQMTALASTPRELLRGAIILKPGTGIYTTTSGNNLNNVTSYEWYERAINPSEEFER